MTDTETPVKVAFTRSELQALLYTAYLYEDLSEMLYDLNKIFGEEK